MAITKVLSEGHASVEELQDMIVDVYDLDVDAAYICNLYTGCNHGHHISDFISPMFLDDEFDICDEFDYRFVSKSTTNVEIIYLELIQEIKDGICPECVEEGVIYCDTLPAPIGFEKIVKYHGIAAYNIDGLGTAGDYLCRIQSIINNPEWQICCSTKPIGPIGIIVDAEVICASNSDLYTYIDHSNGRRYFNKDRYRASHLIYDAKDLDPTVWSHDEIVTKNSVPAAVWVFDRASKEIKEYGRFISKVLGIEYMEVEKSLGCND